MIVLDSFGARFGALVRDKRGLNGWSQERLAEEIWDDKARKSHVSKLERGGIPNPQANTVDDHARVLNITPEEIAALRAPPSEPEGTPARPLILENLALRFGADNPDAPPEALEEFLREKARDYQAMQERLVALGRAEANIANLIGAAQAALEAGDFDEADARLRVAEEMQQEESTLKEVRKQAEIRVQRGEAELLKDAAETATAHFLAAADFFNPFDWVMGFVLRDQLARVLWSHSMRFGGNAINGALKLCEENVRVSTERGDLFRVEQSQNNLAIALCDQAARVEEASATALLGEAVKAFRIAPKVGNQAEHPVRWAMTQNDLGIALATRAEQEMGAVGAALLREAVAAYRAALNVRTRAEHPLDWASTYNNLAAALQANAGKEEGSVKATLLEEAVQAYRAVVQVLTRSEHPVRWAMTQNNLAGALWRQAAMQDSTAGGTLLADSLNAYHSALEVRTRFEHPVD